MSGIEGLPRFRFSVLSAGCTDSATAGLWVRAPRLWGVVLAYVAIITIGGCSSPTAPDWPHVAVVSNDDGRLISGEKIRLTSVSRAFYQRHADVFDFLVLFSLTHLHVAEADSDDLAFYMTIRNNVSGIGLPATFDLGDVVGSDERLQGVIYMGDVWRFYDRETGTISADFAVYLAHEIGHRFCAYVRVACPDVPPYYLLDFRRDHWTLAMQTGGSPMGGHLWRDNRDGSFTAMERWTGPYCPLDLYLMGLASPAEVGPITVLDIDPRPYSVPLGTTLHVATRTFSVDDVIAAEGPRIPPYDHAPRSWRAAFALVVPDMSSSHADALAAVETLRLSWSDEFAQLTGGRGHMATTLSVP